jgi:hypothetical protein
MNSKMGPISYGDQDEQIFLGKEIAVRRDYSEETAREIDNEVRTLMNECHERARQLLTAHTEELHRVAKSAGKGYDPDRAGIAIANALNQNAPAFLLLNDIHGLVKGEDSDRFLQVLHTMFDRIEKGVMVAITSSESYFDYLMTGQESLLSRINKRLVVQPLNDQEAGLMIAKRLLAKRVVDDMPALYPFTDSAIKAMNFAARGSPRELLKVADKVVEEAARRKMIQINDEAVKMALSVSEDAHEENLAASIGAVESGLEASKI